MKKIEILERRRVYEGFFSVDEATVRYERPDGSMSEPAKRLSVERGDAVAIVVYRRDLGQLLLVRQFRYPTLRHDDPYPLEIVAGSIDPGETAEEAARREVFEEIGYVVDTLKPVSEFYSSPGGMSEMLHIFYAEVDASMVAHRGGGLPDEDVEVVSQSVDTLRTMVRAGEIRDGKTLVGLYWFFNES